MGSSLSLLAWHKGQCHCFLHAGSLGGVGAGLQRARHAQPGLPPGSALLVQDPWASHSLG